MEFHITEEQRRLQERCRALAAGSREKSVESAVKSARRPAIATIGEERDGAGRRARNMSANQASARIPKTT